MTPLRIDPSGVAGPTRHQAYGPNWRRTSPGLFVPAGVVPVVEQRIVEAAARVSTRSAVSGWASLRWRGATYFDGRAGLHGDALPVPLAAGRRCIRPDPAIEVLARQLPPWERETYDGLPCATTARALFDEIIRLGSVLPSAVAIDMTIAAGLIDLSSYWAYLESAWSRNGVVLARAAGQLARGTSRSPQEAWMRLTWEVEAGLPEPLCNVPVFDLHGNLLGIPDLLDVEAGVVGEYQGAVHRELERHRRDVRRAAGFRDHGLEYFEVVGGEMRGGFEVVQRMRAARQRGLANRSLPRRWTLDQPGWWTRRAS